MLGPEDASFSASAIVRLIESLAGRPRGWRKRPWRARDISIRTYCPVVEASLGVKPSQYNALAPSDVTAFPEVGRGPQNRSKLNPVGQPHRKKDPPLQAGPSQSAERQI